MRSLLQLGDLHLERVDALSEPLLLLALVDVLLRQLLEVTLERLDLGPDVLAVDLGRPRRSEGDTG